MSVAYTIQLYLAQASLVYGSQNAEIKEFIHQKAKINSKKPEVLFVTNFISLVYENICCQASRIQIKSRSVLLDQRHKKNNFCMALLIGILDH